MELGRGGPGLLLSPCRLTDKPTGYGPVFRGSNPRKETINIKTIKGVDKI